MLILVPMREGYSPLQVTLYVLGVAVVVNVNASFFSGAIQLKCSCVKSLGCGLGSRMCRASVATKLRSLVGYGVYNGCKRG